jgi:hypothetical protein
MGRTVINRIIITDRTTWLYKGGNTGFMTQPHTVIEGEESITGHHRTMQVKIELLCFFKRLAERIDPAGLAATLSDQLFILY